MKAVNDATEGNSKEALIVFFIVTDVLASPKEDPIVHYKDELLQLNLLQLFAWWILLIKKVGNLKN